MINGPERQAPSPSVALRVAGVVIVAPSATYHPWNAAVAAAANAAGYGVIAYGGETDLPVSETPRLIVTHDPALTVGVERDWTVAILGDIGTAPAQCADLFGATTLEGFQIASGILANMALLPGDTVYLPEHNGGATMRLGPDIEVVSPTTSQSWPPSDAESAIQEALTLYRGGDRSTVASVRWAPALFRFGARRHGEAAPGPKIELTGRARAVVYGPYIGLWPGRWSITVRFLIDEHGASHRFRFEWGSGQSVSEFAQAPGRPGEFEVTLTQDWWEPARAEFKIVLDQGSLGGELELLGADVSRLGDPEKLPALTTEVQGLT